MGKVITLSGLHMGAVNPASDSCIAKGGTLESFLGPDGQYNICTLPGGTQCEEWALYNGTCGQGEEKEPSRLLNYGIVMGVGAIAGLIVSSRSKKASVRFAGMGAGAALSAMILALTWPKKAGA